MSNRCPSANADVAAANSFTAVFMVFLVALEKCGWSFLSLAFSLSLMWALQASIAESLDVIAARLGSSKSLMASVGIPLAKLLLVWTPLLRILLVVMFLVCMCRTHSALSLLLNHNHNHNHNHNRSAATVAV